MKCWCRSTVWMIGWMVKNRAKWFGCTQIHISPQCQMPSQVSIVHCCWEATTTTTSSCCFYKWRQMTSVISKLLSRLGFRCPHNWGSTWNWLFATYWQAVSIYLVFTECWRLSWYNSCPWLCFSSYCQSRQLLEKKLPTFNMNLRPGCNISKTNKTVSIPGKDVMALRSFL